MNTREQVINTLKKFTVSGLFKDWNYSFLLKSEQVNLVLPDNTKTYYLRDFISLVVMTPDINSSSIVPIELKWLLEWETIHSPRDIWNLQRRMLINFVNHEVDESIVIEGKRLYDPHLPPPYLPPIPKKTSSKKFGEEGTM